MHIPILPPLKLQGRHACIHRHILLIYIYTCAVQICTYTPATATQCGHQGLRVAIDPKSPEAFMHIYIPYTHNAYAYVHIPIPIYPYIHTVSIYIYVISMHIYTYIYIYIYTYIYLSIYLSIYISDNPHLHLVRGSAEHEHARDRLVQPVPNVPMWSGGGRQGEEGERLVQIEAALLTCWGGVGEVAQGSSW